MFKYAIDNGYIKDIDDYLTQITERQDFNLNITKMSEENLIGETVQWLERLNKTFGNSYFLLCNKNPLLFHRNRPDSLKHTLGADAVYASIISLTEFSNSANKDIFKVGFK